MRKHQHGSIRHLGTCNDTCMQHLQNRTNLAPERRDWSVVWAQCSCINAQANPSIVLEHTHERLDRESVTMNGADFHKAQQLQVIIRQVVRKLGEGGDVVEVHQNRDSMSTFLHICPNNTITRRRATYSMKNKSLLVGLSFFGRTVGDDSAPQFFIYAHLRSPCHRMGAYKTGFRERRTKYKRAVCGHLALLFIPPGKR